MNFLLRFKFSTGGERGYAGPRPSVNGFRMVAGAAGRSCPGDSCWCERQVAHSDQVIGRQCEAEHPADSRNPAMASLTQPAHGLEPAKDLFHLFALALTNRIAPMPGGALVDDTGLLAREMRSYSMVAQFLNQFFAVVTFVGAQRDSLPAWNLLYHRQRRLRFSASGSSGYAAVDRQPVAILHQHMAGVTELGLFAFPLARHEGLRIGSGLVGIVAAPFAMKVHARIARIVGRGLGVRVVFALKALLPCPRLDQGAVDREVLIREQTTLAGLSQLSVLKIPSEAQLEEEGASLMD